MMCIDVSITDKKHHCEIAREEWKHMGGLMDWLRPVLLIFERSCMLAFAQIVSLLYHG